MKFNLDDPRLTAYALGELPEHERREIEVELQASPEGRQLVEEIRQTARALADELAAEPAPSLSPAQRSTIEAQTQPANIVRLPRRKVVVTLTLAAMAACVMFLLAFQMGVGSRKIETGYVAINDDATAQPMDAPEATLPSADARTEVPPLAQTDPALYPTREAVYDSPQRRNLSESKVTLNVERTKDKSETKTWYSAEPAAPPMLGGMQVQENVSQGTTTLGENLTLAGRPAGQTILDPTTGLPTGGMGGGGGGGAGWSVNGPATATAPAQNVYSVSIVGYTDAGVTESAEKEVIDSFRFYSSSDNGGGTARYPHLTDNSFLTARNAPLSTFSIDVDTASYANVRRFLNEGRMPPRDAVRIEELINYFSYQYPQPRGEDPFAANIEVAGCPWSPEHRLVRIGIKGREIARDKRPPSNFVFLIDVSGSMQPNERLPLIKQALRQLVKKMTENDRVAIVVYASEAGLKLESTSCSEKEKILQAIDELGAGGSTNGGDGIRQAYRVAEENFIRGGVNRVLLCTDGDFNVGMTDQNELVRMIQQKARSGVFLTTLGVGTDNYKDALMQKLADKGNGNYHYLDTLEEAQKVLIDQMNGTLVTIAKDVKIQVEFNPAQVNAYRLIGYEKRLLRKEDFNNDAKDAGEIGAGHTVTALYEIVPAGQEVRGPVDDLKYQPAAEAKAERYVAGGSRELLTLKLRYKQPDGDRSRLLEFPVTDSGKRFANASPDFRFAAAVASFGMLLRNSEYKGDSSYRSVLEWAERSKGTDVEGYRSEFVNLVRKARSLRPAAGE